MKYSRDTRDLERMWEHLGRLDELARRMASERKISRDGAHAILRREAEVMLTNSSRNGGVVDDAARACATSPDDDASEVATRYREQTSELRPQVSHPEAAVSCTAPANVGFFRYRWKCRG